ncbi:pentapeptide repeat-containing protein [Crocosphaera sp. Alani8]|uniref:pentapeptide repeat-containing protein n=1 Tax=Crocosphaera sp. Alani8 TaxID=3038952 RepID=UPI00313D0DF8
MKTSEINLEKVSVFDPLIVPEHPKVQQLINDLKQGKRNLKDTDWAELDLSGLDLSNTDLRDSNFFNCELRCVNFTEADLGSANFKGANLRTANLANTDLHNANLSDTDLCHVSLEGANLKDTKFQRVKCYRTLLRNTTLPDGTLVKFKMSLTGDSLCVDELMNHYQKCYQRRKKIIGFGLFILFCLGVEVLGHSLSLIFSLMG